MIADSFGTVRICDLSTPEGRTKPRVLRGIGRNAGTVALSPSGDRLAVGDDFDSIHLFDLREAEPADVMITCSRTYNNTIARVVFHPASDRWLAAEDFSRRAWLVDLEKPSPLKAQVPGESLATPFYSTLSAYISGMTFGTKSETFFATDDDGRVQAIDLAEMNLSDPSIQPRVWADGGESSSGSSELRAPCPTKTPTASGRRSPPTPRQCRFTWVGPPSCRPRRSALMVGPSPSRGATMSSASETWRIRRRLRWRWDASIDLILALAFNHKGDRLAAGDQKGVVNLWDLTLSPDARKATALPGNGKPICSLSFSPRGKWLAVGPTDGPALLWALGEELSLKPRALLGNPKSSTNAMAFHPRDPRWLVTGQADGSVTLCTARRTQAIRN